MKTVTFNNRDQEEFFKTLRARVNEYFKTNKLSKQGGFGLILKTLFMLALYLIPLSFILFWVDQTSWNLFMWTLMGFGMAGLGLSVMHDANHGTFSKNKHVNDLVSKVILLLGGNDVNWRIQHNLLHHTYTNITGLDEDIKAPTILLRFSPHTKRYRIHRFQYLYAWPFYGLMTLMWFVIKDYNQGVRYTKKDLIRTQKISNLNYWLTMIISKILYAFVFLALPIYLSPLDWYINILGFLLMQFICGLALTLIFQSAHVVSSSDFPMSDSNGSMENNWAIHQLHTTANFAPNGKFFFWFIGGLNFQVEHHLFPNICHVHYRNISKIVEKTAHEFELPYYSNTTFLKAIQSHGQMLYSLGVR